METRTESRAAPRGGLRSPTGRKPRCLRSNPLCPVPSSWFSSPGLPPMAIDGLDDLRRQRESITPLPPRYEGRRPLTNGAREIGDLARERLLALNGDVD